MDLAGAVRHRVRVTTPSDGDRLELLEPLQRGAFGEVWRGRLDERPVAVKIAAGAERATVQQSFRREAAALAALRHPALPAVLHTGERDGRAFLVMELIDGRSLADVLADEGPLPPPRVRTIGCELADVLAVVHEHGLIHRDVKPRNVMVRPDGSIALVDFGLAQASTTGRTEEVAGTVRYAAPEQLSGERIDARVDLHGLGATLYHALAGRPPFESSDLRERLLSPPPPPPANAPADLGRLVLRLLAPEPDARPRSAREVRAALGDEVGDRAAGSPSEPAHDVPFARGSSLLDALLDALQAPSTVVRLVGEGGSGKTRLTREALRRGDPAGEVVFASGRPHDPLPLGPLRRGLQGWFTGLRGRPDAETARAAFAVAGAPYAALLSPLLRPTDVPWDRVDTGASPAAERAPALLAGFFASWAATAGALTLVFDDAQWSATGTRALAQELAARRQEAPIRLLWLERPTAAAAPIDADRTLELQPFGREGTAAIVSALLGPAVDDAVVDAVDRRAHGLPLEVIELVRSAVDDGLVRLRFGRWELDAPQWDAWKVSPRVEALVVRRAAGLGELGRRVLDAAALLGQPVDASLLATVLDAPTPALEAALGETRDARLLVPTAEGRHEIPHDRTREALLDRIDEERAAELHARLADALRQRPAADHTHLYAIAEHDSRGPIEGRRERTVASNRAAGRLALEEHTPDAAHRFFERAQALADDADLPTSVDDHLAAARAAQLTGHYEAVEAHLGHALSGARSEAERAEVHRRRAWLAMVCIRSREAAREVNAAAAILGDRPLRERWSSLFGSLALLLGFACLGVRSARRAVRGPRRERARAKAVLYETATVVHYQALRPLSALRATLRGVWAARQLGPGPELAIALGALAVATATMGLRRWSRRWAHEARAQARATGEPFVLARVALFSVIERLFGGDERQAERMARRAIEEHEVWLDPFDLRSIAGSLAWSLYVRGHARESLALAQRSFDPATGAAADDAVRSSVIHTNYRYVVDALSAAEAQRLGDRGEARRGREAARAFGSDERAADPYHAALVHQLLLVKTLRAGADDATIEAAVEVLERGSITPLLAPSFLRQGFVAAAEARRELCDRAPSPARRRAFGRALRRLALAAGTPSLRCHRTILEAARARMRGRVRSALRRLAKAERLAARHDDWWARHALLRERARVWAAAGDETAAASERRMADAIARELGWWVARDDDPPPRGDEAPAIQPDAPAGASLARRRSSPDDETMSVSATAPGDLNRGRDASSGSRGAPGSTRSVAPPR